MFRLLLGNNSFYFFLAQRGKKNLNGNLKEKILSNSLKHLFSSELDDAEENSNFASAA